MADYDRRQSGGYNPRKRRYRDDEDHFDRRQQRRRTDAPPPVRLRRQLVGIADSPLRRWAEEIQSVANLVADHHEEEHMRNIFLEILIQLALEQPLKTPFSAAVVLMVNAQRPEITTAVLDRFTKALESSIAKGEWKETKLYLKFLACIQGCLEGDGVFPVLTELFNRAADLQTASSEDTIGAEIVKVILLTLPYVMSSAADQFKQKAADLMEKTDIIASEPHILQSLVDPYHTENGKPSPTSTSMLTLLQQQLQAEAGNDWALSFLPRPWQMPLEHVEAQDKLANAQKHQLPAIEIPTTVIAGPRGLFPEVYFSVYADQEVESVPGENHLASSLIRDVMADTINGLHFNRNATARFLMDIDSYFTEGTFVKRATPFDELRNTGDGRPSWKPEDVAVDTVFAQLFQLPASPCKVVYYHGVLIEACKLAPAAIAPSLGRAIRYLYRNSPRMDLELSYRFTDWFAHHLSNFGFTWKWQEWAEDAGLQDLDARKWFLKGALDKEVRLSFAQRIQKTLPDEYLHMVGREKEQDVPDFKFEDAETPFSAEGLEIASLLRRKATDEEMQPTVEAIAKQAAERGLDPLVSCMDVFVTAVCWVGSKSLSHVLACIDRTKGRMLDSANASPAARAQIIGSVMAYWSAHPGIALSITEKLLNYSILTPYSVVEWALVASSPANVSRDGASLAEPYIFELIFNTVTKVSARTRQVVSAIDTDADARAAEAESSKKLFVAIDDALGPWAGTSDDDAMTSSDDRESLVRRWGQRWQRVFKRRAAIEATFVQEASIAAAAAAEAKANEPMTDAAAPANGDA